MHALKGINSILFIADNAPDESSALRRTTELAKSLGARLVVMDVIELSTLEGEVLRKVYPHQNLMDKLVAARETELREKVEPYINAGIEIKVKVSAGRYHHAVSHAIRRSGHKLLVKSPKGPKQDPHAIGPMDLRLIARTPCPVLLLRNIPTGAVLASISLDTRHDATSGLDDTLIKFAHTISDIRHVPLHLVHAWEMPDEKIINAVSSESESECFRQQIEHAHKVLLEKFLNRHQDIKYQSHLVEGWTSHVVPRLVEELEISLLVIGATQKVKSDHSGLGSIVDVILQQIRCSALILKP